MSVFIQPGSDSSRANDAFQLTRVYRTSSMFSFRNLVHTFPNDPTIPEHRFFTDTIFPAVWADYYYWVTSVYTFGNEKSENSPASNAAPVSGSVGSTPYSNTGNFTYTTPTTSITWSWGYDPIYRSDARTL